MATKFNLIIGIVFLLTILQSTQSAIAAGLTNSCVDCHRKLLFSSESQSQFVDQYIKHIDNGISCSIECHEDRQNKSIASSYALWLTSSHYQYNVTCEKCHGGNPMATSKADAHLGLSSSSIARENTPEMCGKCHETQLEEFKSSLHFQRLKSEEIPAPACVTCHQAHSVHVLTMSEIEDFCSNCHNNMTGIDPSVPKRAEKALSSVNELQVQLSQVRSAELNAKALGKNVTEAETELDSAQAIIKNIPSLWHRFDLTYFDTQVQQGFNYTQNAESELEANATNPIPKKTPGFEGILLITGLLIVYFLRRY